METKPVLIIRYPSVIPDKEVQNIKAQILEKYEMLNVQYHIIHLTDPFANRVVFEIVK